MATLIFRTPIRTMGSSCRPIMPRTRLRVLSARRLSRRRCTTTSAGRKREIGSDIKTVQFGWPIGMAVVDHIDGDVWEVQTRLSTRIARVLFFLEAT